MTGVVPKPMVGALLVLCLLLFSLLEENFVLAIIIGATGTEAALAEAHLRNRAFDSVLHQAA
jgi:hypothetical protein